MPPIAVDRRKYSRMGRAECGRAQWLAALYWQGSASEWASTVRSFTVRCIGFWMRAFHPPVSRKVDLRLHEVEQSPLESGPGTMRTE